MRNNFLFGYCYVFASLLFRKIATFDVDTFNIYNKLTFDFDISSVTTVPLPAVPLVCDFPFPITCSSVGVIGFPPKQIQIFIK